MGAISNTYAHANTYAHSVTAEHHPAQRRRSLVDGERPGDQVGGRHPDSPATT